MLQRLFGKHRRAPKIWHPAVGELVCNHYKFKSRADWEARTARLDGSGYLAGKFTAPNMAAWEADSNETERDAILRFVPDLKRRMAAPVPPAPEGPPWYCAALAMFRAEEDYMDEWLDYHAMIGVEHFFLYNNDGDLSRYRRLHDYVAAGRATVIDWPDRVIEHIPEERRLTRHVEGSKKITVQNLAIRHFCGKLRRQTRWVISIDIDEYMVPVTAPDLPGVLRTKQAYAGIEVPRLHFGSMGRIERPEGLIIESYLRSQAEPSSVKSIAQTRRLAQWQRGGAHHFSYA
jgi:hypothetical protein